MRPSSRPTSQPSQLFDTVLDQDIYSCFSGCTYLGATLNPARWGASEFCRFYESTGCDQASVSSYDCVPDCLHNCAGPFCETFSKLSYVCGESTGALNLTHILKLEDSCLSSFTGYETTETQLIFDVTIVFAGFNSSEFLNDDRAQHATIQTIASTMKNVKSSEVVLLNASTVVSDSRRKLLHTQSTSAMYRIDVIIEVLGFKNSQSGLAYEGLRKSLLTAVDTKDVLKTLRTSGKPVYDTLLFDAPQFDTGVITFTAAKMKLIKSSAPSFEPTPLPTFKPSLAPTLLIENTLTITTSIVAASVLLCYCLFILFCLCLRSKKVKPGTKYAQNKVFAVDDNIYVDERTNSNDLDEYHDHFAHDVSVEPNDQYQLGSALEGSTISDDENEIYPTHYEVDEDYVPDLVICDKPSFDVTSPASWDDSMFSRSRVLLPPIDAVVGVLKATAKFRKRRKNRQAIDTVPAPGELTSAQEDRTKLDIPALQAPRFVMRGGEREVDTGSPRPGLLNKRAVNGPRIPPGGGYASDNQQSGERTDNDTDDDNKYASFREIKSGKLPTNSSRVVKARVSPGKVLFNTEVNCLEPYPEKGAIESSESPRGAVTQRTRSTRRRDRTAGVTTNRGHNYSGPGISNNLENDAGNLLGQHRDNHVAERWQRGVAAVAATHILRAAGRRRRPQNEKVTGPGLGAAMTTINLHNGALDDSVNMIES